MKKYILLLLFVLAVLGLKAQNAVIEVPVTLETPYNTMLVHLHYLQPDTYQPATAARSLYGVQDSARASRLAIQLKQVLDGMGLYVQMNTLPRDANYLDTLNGKHYYTPFPVELPQVYLEKIDEKWYYSEETVSQITTIHKYVYPFGVDKLINLLPKFGQKKLLGLYAWQYLGLVFIILLSLFLQFVFSRILNPLVRKLSSSRLYPSLIPKEIIRRLTQLISVWIIVRLIRILLAPLQLPIQTTHFLQLMLKLIGIVLLLLIAMKIIEIVILYFKKFTQRTESKMDEQLVPILNRTLQSIAVILALIYALKLLKFDYTTLIAGISIGGLAIALAAQDTVKNLFGSFTVFFDQPFQIGDWINFGDVNGTVEEVGFRSTRVRTFENSLVYVPNGKLADMVINNYGLRVYRRFNTSFGLTYDTPPDKIQAFVDGLKKIVADHPCTRKDYYEIHFNSFSDSSLDVLFYIFFEVPSWSDELAARHEILMEVLKLAQEIGVSFAFPSRSLYIEKK